MSEALIKQMTERFLGWKLPENFNPDGGISFRKVGNEGTPYEYRYEPSGTNLLDYTQAEAMVRHMVAGLEGFQGIFRDVDGNTILSEVVGPDGQPIRLQGGRSVGQILKEEAAGALV